MFDYEVEYKANGEIKVEIVVLEEFIDSDFVKDFILAYDNNKLDMIISNIIMMM